MMAEITLALNQNAEQGQCGSCHFFERDRDANEWITRGRCKFRMPPTRVYTKQVWNGDSMPLDTVNDTDGCDLWRYSGQTYIVSRRIKPG